MGRATLWKLGNPAMIWRYLVTIFSGHLPGRKGRDIRQMGGSVLIDPNGIVKLNHVSEDSFDRPEVATILELVK